MARKVIIRGGKAWEESNLYFMGKEPMKKESGGVIPWAVTILGFLAVGILVYKVFS